VFRDSNDIVIVLVMIMVCASSRGKECSQCTAYSRMYDVSRGRFPSSRGEVC
jgi:hypothetical protein